MDFNNIDDDPNYFKFINEINLEKIIEFLDLYEGITINDLANLIKVDEKYLEHYLTIIRDHWCSFFKDYGRIFDNKSKWYHIKNTHMYSRYQVKQLKVKYFYN